jgi:hypothetical protein
MEVIVGLVIGSSLYPVTLVTRLHLGDFIVTVPLLKAYMHLVGDVVCREPHDA